jgi:cyclophilin family peptidyl-prolyl cis-trans isomerase
VGKKSQLRRERKNLEEKERKQIVTLLTKTKNPWALFWKRVDFYIYCACFVALILFPIFRKDVFYAGSLAVLHTSKGDIKIELYTDDAPKTAENFIKLANKNYFDGMTWHRVIKGFMIQSGDPKGDGTGGESAFGDLFDDEINADYLGLGDIQVKNYTSLTSQLSADDQVRYGEISVKQYYEQVKGYKYVSRLKSHHMEIGSVAMANRGPGTNGSQFFIVTEQNQPHLDGLHTVFGRVIEGMDVARAISEVATDSSDKPEEPVYINSVEIR